MTSRQGTLFGEEYLKKEIHETPEAIRITKDRLERVRKELTERAEELLEDPNPNEASTRDDFINPVLDELGWQHRLPEPLATPHDRPDYFLYDNRRDKREARTGGPNAALKKRAAMLEAKSWARPLDRKFVSEKASMDLQAPCNQIVRYLHRATGTDVKDDNWGILTNGRIWRLYDGNARSIINDFAEVDLHIALRLPDKHGTGQLALDEEADRELTKFLLLFARKSFRPRGGENESFLVRQRTGSAHYEARVAGNLSKLVFDEIFPNLAKAIAEDASARNLEASPEDIQSAAMILLYRLLFLAFAEDRGLLPVGDPKYYSMSLRKLRRSIVDHLKSGSKFGGTSRNLWNNLQNLCRCINEGEPEHGIAPYNGGLFSDETLLSKINLPDNVTGSVIANLSHEGLDSEDSRYINYRDLSVQQLGSIYERLLEHEIQQTPNGIEIRPNPNARKTSGTYYTPESLVKLVIRETIDPIIEERTKGQDDPAREILKLRICDPAMGSSHFLVTLVDYLADQIAVAMASRTSSLLGEIEKVRKEIRRNAKAGGWIIREDQLEDRHIIRRIILKRCIYGVDKNPIAVELAKVSLWLHTFIVGAPLSFLDHHLRCGDSLFGPRALDTIRKAKKSGSSLFLKNPIDNAIKAGGSMAKIEILPDTAIEETKKSRSIHLDIRQGVTPLENFVNVLHVMQHVKKLDKKRKNLITGWLQGRWGNPVELAGSMQPTPGKHAAGDPKVNLAEAAELKTHLEQSRCLVEEERLLCWETAFPGVWSGLDSEEDLKGGFDAVIGNPPWDRLRMEEVEWFKARDDTVAEARTAAEARQSIASLEQGQGSLPAIYRRIEERHRQLKHIVTSSDAYPLFGRDEMNLYRLFMERAIGLINDLGAVGMLTPSGIAVDHGASRFFRKITQTGRLSSFYDFENRRSRYDDGRSFPDVHPQFRFSAITVRGAAVRKDSADCAFLLQDVQELENRGKKFKIPHRIFLLMNPNTHTMPPIRTKSDYKILERIYRNNPAYNDHSKGQDYKLKYRCMFHMTADSHFFLKHEDLLQLEARKTDFNIYKTKTDYYLPLYVGKMMWLWDHRFASVTFGEGGTKNKMTSIKTGELEREDPKFLAAPSYWIEKSQVDKRIENPHSYALAFRDITNPTDSRTMIAAIMPWGGFGNSLPIFLNNGEDNYARAITLLCANLCSRPLDYIVRQKIQGNHINLYVLEQLPIISRKRLETETIDGKPVADRICKLAFELTYTSRALEAYARDMGHTNQNGKVKPPFKWDLKRRYKLILRLDEIFFQLYGITDNSDRKQVEKSFKIEKSQK